MIGFDSYCKVSREIGSDGKVCNLLSEQINVNKLFGNSGSWVILLSLHIKYSNNGGNVGSSVIWFLPQSISVILFVRIGSLIK